MKQFSINQKLLAQALKEYEMPYFLYTSDLTDFEFVEQLKNDGFFKCIKCLDERSALYMACGIAAEKKAAVSVCCGPGVGSRDFSSGLTEAYYRKLPILAISMISADEDQVRFGRRDGEDVRQGLSDVAVSSYVLPNVNSDSVKEVSLGSLILNQTLIDLSRNGGGPVQLAVETENDDSNGTENSVDKIDQIGQNFHRINLIDGLKDYPEISQKKVGIFLGYRPMSTPKMNQRISKFSEKYQADVLCGVESNYWGKNKRLTATLGAEERDYDLIIHMGGKSKLIDCITAKECWRVGKDELLVNAFGSLNYWFNLTEQQFLQGYLNDESLSDSEENSRANDQIYSQDTFFIGAESILLLFEKFELTNRVISNIGAPGSTGIASMAIGASLCGKSEKRYIAFLSEKEMLKELNVLGNRHIAGNVIFYVFTETENKTIRDYAKALGWQYQTTTWKNEIPSMSGTNHEAPCLIEITQ